MSSLFDRYMPPGQLVQLNNHRLHIQCLVGDGPAVVFESGQAGFSLDWIFVQPGLSDLAHTCSYDRAGLGWSEGGPQPRTPQRVVAELHALLIAARTPRPYVLVAHSLGGRYARLYAHRYPEDVIGMVLVDAYHETFDLALGAERLRRFRQNRARQYRFLDTLAHLGIVQHFGASIIGMLGPDYRALPKQERSRYAQLATRRGAMATTIDEFEQAVASNADFERFTIQNDLPLRVLTHGIPWPSPTDERLWQDSQRHALTWSTRSKLIVAERSGHVIMLAQPGVVIDAIREVVTEARQT